MTEIQEYAFVLDSKGKQLSPTKVNKAWYLITPADEKTHGFNRVDDSPQIF